MASASRSAGTVSSWCSPCGLVSAASTAWRVLDVNACAGPGPRGRPGASSERHAPARDFWGRTACSRRCWEGWEQPAALRMAGPALGQGLLWHLTVQDGTCQSLRSPALAGAATLNVTAGGVTSVGQQGGAVLGDLCVGRARLKPFWKGVFAAGIGREWWGAECEPHTGQSGHCAPGEEPPGRRTELAGDRLTPTQEGARKPVKPVSRKE